MEGGGGIIIIMACAVAGSNIPGINAAAVSGLNIEFCDEYGKPNSSAICWVAAAEMFLTINLKIFKIREKSCNLN